MEGTRFSSEVSHNRTILDLVAQLEEHWTSKPKVTGLISTVIKLIFQLAWLETQSSTIML